MTSNATPNANSPTLGGQQGNSSALGGERIHYRVGIHGSALVLSMLSACVHFTPPERFLVVEQSCDEVRAVTPEDSRLWVRVHDDDDNASLQFWQDALTQDLVKNRGFVLVSEAESVSTSGAKGREFVLETSVNGRTVRELLVLFLTPGLLHQHIHTLEYVADKDAFDKEIDAVRTSVRAYQP